ncbi:MAG: helix-turn-helix domain-containing protein [Elusimicrobiota bacterium]
MPERIYAHAAARIREMRRSQGLPLEELAGRAEITPSYLGQIERMERKPSLLTLSMIADGLRVEPSSILDGQPLPASKNNGDDHRLLAALAGLSGPERSLALQTVRFFLSRFRRLKRGGSL